MNPAVSTLEMTSAGFVLPPDSAFASGLRGVFMGGSSGRQTVQVGDHAFADLHLLGPALERLLFELGVTLKGLSVLYSDSESLLSVVQAQLADLILFGSS